MARDEGVAGVYPFSDCDSRNGDVMLGNIPRVFNWMYWLRRLFLRVVFIYLGNNDSVWRGRRHADWRIVITGRHTFVCVEIYYTFRNTYYERDDSICATVIYADEVVLWIRDSNTEHHRNRVFFYRQNGDCASTLSMACSIGTRGSTYTVLCRCKWHGVKCARVRIRRVKRWEQAKPRTT